MIITVKDMVILTIPPNIALAPINENNPTGAAVYKPAECNRCKNIRPYAAPALYDKNVKTCTKIT